MVPKLPLSAEMKGFLAITPELSDLDTKNLIVSPFLSKSLPPGVKEKRKKLGGRSPPAPPDLKRSKTCRVS